MEENKCEKCGSIMVSFKDGRTIGMKCPNCGWGFVTTQFEPIDLDEIDYTVKIDTIANPSKDQLKTISELLSLNFLITARLLKEGKATFSGKATEILKKAKVLKDNGISYSTVPDFPYEI